ncbi:major capsid protein [Cupriavidus sp. D39]|uniref:major capsid protein n=1 Tax=Cupriavidus sp. D39 TaxID=2997877 RepID=UPI002270E01B|nr:major capsid protein [Cupriavidus sp. D39]MCY0852698.1 major capsid protein [Cupriavidus sp. D39]
MKKNFSAVKALAARAAQKAAVAGVAAGGAVAAHADGITPPDTSSIVTFIVGCVAAVAAIGVATLGVKATVACYTWVRSAIK